MYCKGIEAVPGHRVKTMWVCTLTHIIFLLFVSLPLQLPHMCLIKKQERQLQIFLV